MILIIDNYDSFTYNLVHYVEEHNYKVQVFRNDKITLQKIRKLKPKKIIISPGPCTPDEAGISIDLIKYFYKKFPILGVCLGHQSIGQAFNAKIIKASKIMHGKVSTVTNKGSEIFKGLPKKFDATRYHSLVIKNDTLPENFKIYLILLMIIKKLLWEFNTLNILCMEYNFILKVLKLSLIHI